MDRLGKRFSKITTVYSEAGISVWRPSREGHSGQSSRAGMKVRFCRWDAIITHSSSSGSQRNWEDLLTGGRLRGSGGADTFSPSAAKYSSSRPSASFVRVLFTGLRFLSNSLDLAN